MQVVSRPEPDTAVRHGHLSYVRIVELAQRFNGSATSTIIAERIQARHDTAIRGSTERSARNLARRQFGLDGVKA